jgi:hypothetical protein
MRKRLLFLAWWFETVYPVLQKPDGTPILNQHGTSVQDDLRRWARSLWWKRLFLFGAGVVLGLLIE